MMKLNWRGNNTCINFILTAQYFYKNYAVEKKYEIKNIFQQQKQMYTFYSYCRAFLAKIGSKMIMFMKSTISFKFSII